MDSRPTMSGKPVAPVSRPHMGDGQVSGVVRRRADGDRLRWLVDELIERRDRQRRAAGAAAAGLADVARSERAPRELRAVQRRVDRGELSWEQVVLGSSGAGGGSDAGRASGGSGAFGGAGLRGGEGGPGSGGGGDGSAVEAVRRLWRSALADLPGALHGARTLMERESLDPARAASRVHAELRPERAESDGAASTSAASTGGVRAGPEVVGPVDGVRAWRGVAGPVDGVPAGQVGPAAHSRTVRKSGSAAAALIGDAEASGGLRG